MTNDGKYVAAIQGRMRDLRKKAIFSKPVKLAEMDVLAVVDQALNLAQHVTGCKFEKEVRTYTRKAMYNILKGLSTQDGYIVAPGVMRTLRHNEKQGKYALARNARSTDN